MRILLGCLMCFVLSASQGLAISGGPFGNGGNVVSVTGIYAGVLVPIPVVISPGPPEVTLTDNSLALFTLKIPQVGLASGTSAVFRNGIFYSGTIQGSADPDSMKVTAIVNSFFQLTVAESSTTTAIFQYNANGQFLNAKVVPDSNPFSGVAARIKGKAALTYTNNAPDPATGITPDPSGDSGGPLQYKIHGFKQSSSTS